MNPFFRHLRELNWILPFMVALIPLVWFLSVFRGATLLSDQIIGLTVLSLVSAVLLYYLLRQNRLIDEQQARFEASINNINMGFVVTDTKGEVMSINPAAKRILFNDNTTAAPAILRNTTNSEQNLKFKKGCTIKEISNQFKNILDLEHHLRRCLVEKKTVSIENIVFKDRYLHLFLTPIVVLKENNLGLDFIGAVILIEDQTNQKLVERSKDEFFSIASHELKTPLGVIRSNAQMLQNYFGTKIGSRAFTEMVDDIYHSAINLIGIVNDFLDVSRLEQGRIEYQKQNFDLSHIIEQTVQELSAIASTKGLFLLYQKPQQPLSEVSADPEKVRQVLTNIIGNAIKYTDSGEVRIYLMGENNLAKVTVVDSGKGIAVENQKLLFRKFQSASTSLLTRDSSLKSTGLGLYISKLLVEGMGGQIKLESSIEGKGSTFSFTLPFSNNQEITVKPYIPPQAASAI